MMVFLSVSSGSRCSNIYFLSLHKIYYLRIAYLLSNDINHRIAIGAVLAALFFLCITLHAKGIKYTGFIGVWYHKSDGIQ